MILEEGVSAAVPAEWGVDVFDLFRGTPARWVWVWVCVSGECDECVCGVCDGCVCDGCVCDGCVCGECCGCGECAASVRRVCGECGGCGECGVTVGCVHEHLFCSRC